MTPGPSFTIPTTSNPAPAETVPALDHRQSITAEPSTSAHRLEGNPDESSIVAGSSSHQSDSDGLRRSESTLAQPKHCARCGQLLDALPSSQDRQPSLPRTSSSASMSAPSPSSYAFAPDSIRSQHRLQPHQSLTSAINAAAAVALSRHLNTDESIPVDADRHAVCTQCAAQLADAAAAANLALPTAASTQTAVSPSTQIPPASASSHTIDTQQSQSDTSRTPNSEAQNSNAHNSTQSAISTDANPDFSPNASHAATSATPQIDAPQTQLTISVDNMGAGGDAAVAQSAEDVHMHDPSAFPPLERAPLSPALRAPSSPPGVGRSTSRGRIRFADASASNGDALDQQRSADVHGHAGESPAGGSSSYALGRSGSFSRSLSYNGSGLGPESLSSSSAPVIVSFPASSIPIPISETATTLSTHGTHIVASSIASSLSSSAQSPAMQTRSRSSSHLNASTGTHGTTSHAHVPAPANAIPGGVKQRRPSSTRRLSRSGSSTGPTTMPFAAVGTSASANASAVLSRDDDPYGPGAVTRPRLSLLPMHVIADELYNSAQQIRPASLISSSTSTSLAASSAQHAAGIDPNRAVKYHLDPLSFSRADSTPQHAEDEGKKQDESMDMDVDDHKVASGLAAKWGDVRWFDPYKPDPLAELSRLRTPPKGRGCLYPGATFNGTQKSGRNSYDVTVRIVNVDLEVSHLCGYLNIRGLTEDWPELTTYFDAEIIGDRYGFVTGKWGATEADDLKHWARFPPFRPLRSALSKPGLRFNHLNKPFVFMRWKEKFLVPDHRVRDINGASFAGFYYVCVELGESAGRPPAAGAEARGRSNSNVSMASTTTGGHSTLSPAGSPTLSHPTTAAAAGSSNHLAAPSVSGPQWYAARTQRRRELSLSAPSFPLSSTSPTASLAQAFHQQQQQASQNNVTYYHPIYHPHSPHGLPPSGPGFWPASPTSPHMPLSAGGGEDPFANMWQSEEDDSYEDLGAMGKMSGFYFHENSEPYQQLSLHHTAESCSSNFEMR
ncbi:uncharacterized protein UTRI_00254 [Ustilago trichophora]|uniref:Uncharacterized protein n=1 Tax=Ustilago trichophora TaxID=86804 RepID=A0A5C3DTN8_9BASI|nr:uncharacterized protein UTRI_00254 [Ustilago trichophora]